MNKKGFTLVELLAVIVILALLALLTSTAVTKLVSDSKSELSDIQIKSIKEAAEVWAADNLEKIPVAGECIYLILSDLKEYGLLDSTILNPMNNKEISDDLKIKITTTTSSYGNPLTNYEVNPDNINNCVWIYGNKENTTSYTGEIYRNSEEYLYIGNYINTENRWCKTYTWDQEELSSCKDIYMPLVYNSKTECEADLEDFVNSGYTDATCQQETLTYETNVENITQNHYLKHEVVNNVVTASYACITYTENGTRKDVCLRGADSSYYESNQTILSNAEPYFNTLDNTFDGADKGICYFYESYSYCYAGSFSLFVYSDGAVNTDDGGLYCDVDSDGLSNCKVILNYD